MYHHLSRVLSHIDNYEAIPQLPQYEHTAHPISEHNQPQQTQLQKALPAPTQP